MVSTILYTTLPDPDRKDQPSMNVIELVRQPTEQASSFSLELTSQLQQLTLCRLSQTKIQSRFKLQLFQRIPSHNLLLQQVDPLHHLHYIKQLLQLHPSPTIHLRLLQLKQLLVPNMKL